jgi:hypothetical protein
LEFLRGYAGCPVPEGCSLAIDLALDGADGGLTLGKLVEYAARTAGLDRRVCTSAVLRLVWERALFVDLSGGPSGCTAA